VTDASQTSLTPQQVEKVRTICDRYARAWHHHDSPSIEAAAAGVDSQIRPALLQHLAEVDVQCRITGGSSVDLETYLHRWPDLDRAKLENALVAARDGDQASISMTSESAEKIKSGPPAPLCSVDEFLKRLRDSRLLPDDEITAAASSVASASSTILGDHFIAARKLTPFQVNTLLHNANDPLTLGEYVVQDFVGRGGMGTVYRAIHRRMKRTVAIKVLRRDISHADLLAKRFLREVEVAAKLCHPNIVTAYDASEQNGMSYLVSEFVEGQNLSDLVKEYGPLSLPLAVDVVQQAARALEYAHGAGVIHRDIKPSNLLIDDAGNVKLLDVGLARISSGDSSEIDHAADLTTTGMIMGTVDYMSPEQALNTRLADERSDVYSLGCTLFFLITGRAPYARGTGMERLLAHREQPIPALCSLSQEIPDSIDQLLKSMLAKQPADRMKSMKELVAQLESLKSTGLPDVTLPLSAIDDNTAYGESVSSASDESVTEPSQPSATVVAPASESDHLHAAESWRGNKELSADIPTDIMPVPAFKKTELPASRSTKTSSKSALTYLPWVLLPGIAAVFVGVLMMQPNMDDSSKSATIGSTLPLTNLTDLSEPEVQAHRTNWAASRQLDENVNLRGVDFTLIPAGEFLYGDSAVATRIDTGFYLSQTEVTVGQFATFVESQQFKTVAETNSEGGWGQDPESLDAKRWIQSPSFNWKNLGAQFISGEHPATSLAYSDMIAFCDWMSRETKSVVRLPTEQEWEYACRCGRQGRWSFGDDPQLLPEYAWFETNADKDIHPTRLRKPNAWGLHDMHGNEFERCLVPDAESTGYSGSGPIRGGNIFSTVDETSSSSRLMSPLNSPTHGAFRILMELKSR
jgi:serine/threonine protein kinase